MFFFKKTAAVALLNEQISLGMKLRKEEPMNLSSGLDKASLEEGIDSAVGLIPSHDVFSSVITVPASLSGEILAAHIKKHFSEFLPLDWKGSHVEWEKIGDLEGGRSKYLLLGVPESSVDQLSSRVDFKSVKSKLWIPEYLAVLNGFSDQIKQADSMILAFDFGQSWLLLGMHHSKVIHSERVPNMDEFRDFYDAFTQEAGAFPSQLVAITDKEWPRAYKVESILSSPALVHWPASSQDIEIRMLNGALSLLSKTKKVGFYLSAPIKLA